MDNINNLVKREKDDMELFTKLMQIPDFIKLGMISFEYGKLVRLKK